MADWNTLRLEVDGHVARLHLARPEKLNSFTQEMWVELKAVGDQLCADPGGVRALVVIGDGRAFSSGIDTSVFASDLFAAPEGIDESADATLERMLATISEFQAAFSWCEHAPFVTIAAIRGYAFGAGLQLAIACDIRVAAEGSKLGLLELKYGILPDLGGTQRLPRLVGYGKAVELTCTTARIDATEALRIGLVEQVVADADLESAADALAGTIAAQPPLPVRGVKRAMQASYRLDREAGLRFEAEQQAVCLRSDDMREALAAFLEGRPAVYRGR
jgi:enoyl-CoA hydratase/carnithine racemase